MSEPALLHGHPTLAGKYFPGYRSQVPAGQVSADLDRILYFPGWLRGVLPDLAAARALQESLGAHRPGRVILVSSALIHGAGFRNPGLMSESQVPVPRLQSVISKAWKELEALFLDALPGRLTVLRSTPCPLLEPDSLFGAMLQARRIPRFPLFDPPLQFLHPDDLAGAVEAAWSAPPGEIFNVAPSDVLNPSRLIQVHGWKAARLSALRPDAAELKEGVADLFRYPWTLSGDKARIGLGFTAASSSHEALRLPSPSGRERDTLDPFGMDLDYIGKHCRGIAGFLHDRYFRVDYENEERIPESGSGVLAGVHRGFMPFDGLMMMVYFHTRHRAVLRIPIHHSLHKTPVPFNFPKLGGIPAFADNIDRVIRSGQWVAMYPEGINGAFKLYKNAYRLGSFGFSELARCAIRNQVPVVPFVTIGNVEIFPIVKKLQWKWFQDKTLWPAFPLAPPFPLFPVPLPTKWKTVFLDPIHAEQEYSPKDADNGEIAGRLGSEIKGRMQDKLSELRAARKSWWW